MNEKQYQLFLQEFLNPTKPFDGGIPVPPSKTKIKVDSPRKNK